MSVRGIATMPPANGPEHIRILYLAYGPTSDTGTATVEPNPEEVSKVESPNPSTLSSQVFAYDLVLNTIFQQLHNSANCENTKFWGIVPTHFPDLHLFREIASYTFAVIRTPKWS